MEKKPKLVGLYALTDRVLTPYEGGKILKLIEKVLKGGARLIQLRDKNTPDEKLYPVALELKELCQAYGALFIVNDRVELAKKVSADGVHLGKEDLPLERIKEVFSGGLVGISCYADLARAKKAEELSANYVAFGSFFPSPTKPTAPLAPLELLSEAKKVLSLPVCAIGGITLERAEEVLKRGADLIAVISDLWNSDDPEKRAKEYTELFKKYEKL